MIEKRFDLEQGIIQCWNITDDLDFVLELIEGNDEATNLVIGLKQLYQMKFEKCWADFEEFLSEKKTKQFGD